MAIFNPNPAEVQDPYYLQLSRSIEQPKANTSAAEALKGIGDVGGDAIKVAHTLTQNSIQDEEYKRLSGERSDFRASLDAVYDSVTGQAKPQTQVTDASLNVLTTPQANSMPKGLEDVPKTLESLDAARASGRYSQTFLDMKYDTVLKDLRSRYPGWREYIDEEAKKVTGRDPANDYIKSKVADINSWVAANKDDKNKILAESYKTELMRVPQMPVMRQLFEDGKITKLEFNTFMTDSQRLHWDVEQNKLELEKAQGNKTYQTTQAEDIATKLVSQAVTNHLAVLHAGTGLSSDPAQLASSLERLSQNPDQAIQLAQSIHAGALGIQEQMVARLKIPDLNVNGKMTSVWDMLGADKANKLIQDNLTPIKEYANLISNKEYGAAVLLEQQNKGLENKSVNILYKNPSTAGILLALHGINHSAGPAAVAAMASISLLTDVPGLVKSVVNADFLGITANLPDPTTGKPRTMDDTTDTINKAKTVQPLFGSPKVMMSYINTFEKIASKDPSFSDEQKGSWFHFMFGSTEGRNWLAKIERDGNNPVTGKPTAGQYSIYQRVLSPQIIGEAKRIGGQAWEDTKNWAENTFGAQLLKPDVLMMKDIAIDPRLSFQWDDKNNQFKVANSKGEDMLTKRALPGQPRVSDFEQATINRINSGLRNLAIVAKTDGKDVSEYLVNQLVGMGFDPTDPNAPKGIPEHMVKALTAVKAKALKEQEEKDKAYKKQP